MKHRYQNPPVSRKPSNDIQWYKSQKTKKKLRTGLSYPKLQPPVIAIIIAYLCFCSMQDWLFYRVSYKMPELKYISGLFLFIPSPRVGVEKIIFALHLCVGETLPLILKTDPIWNYHTPPRKFYKRRCARIGFVYPLSGICEKTVNTKVEELINTPVL